MAASQCYFSNICGRRGQRVLKIFNGIVFIAGLVLGPATPPTSARPLGTRRWLSGRKSTPEKPPRRVSENSGSLAKHRSPFPIPSRPWPSRQRFSPTAPTSSWQDSSPVSLFYFLGHRRLPPTRSGRSYRPSTAARPTTSLFGGSGSRRRHCRRRWQTRASSRRAALTTPSNFFVLSDLFPDLSGVIYFR